MMPHDMSTRWNSTYDMLEFAPKYHATLDIMTADRDMKLCKFELSKKEWGMATELCEVLRVCLPFPFFFEKKLTYFNLRFSSTEPSFFHATHPTSAR